MRKSLKQLSREWANEVQTPSEVFDDAWSHIETVGSWLDGMKRYYTADKIVKLRDVLADGRNEKQIRMVIDRLYENGDIDAEQYEYELAQRVTGMKYGTKKAQRILDKSGDWSGRWPVVEQRSDRYGHPKYVADDGYAYWNATNPAKRPALYYTGEITESSDDYANVDDMVMIAAHEIAA
jgi:hypothetical protein